MNIMKSSSKSGLQCAFACTMGEEQTHLVGTLSLCGEQFEDCAFCGSRYLPACRGSPSWKRMRFSPQSAADQQSMVGSAVASEVRRGLPISQEPMLYWAVSQCCSV